jgi:hypothetical protein
LQAIRGSIHPCDGFLPGVIRADLRKGSESFFSGKVSFGGDLCHENRGDEPTRRVFFRLKQYLCSAQPGFGKPSFDPIVTSAVYKAA